MPDGMDSASVAGPAPSQPIMLAVWYELVPSSEQGLKQGQGRSRRFHLAVEASSQLEDICALACEALGISKQCPPTDVRLLFNDTVRYGGTLAVHGIGDGDDVHLVAPCATPIQVEQTPYQHGGGALSGGPSAELEAKDDQRVREKVDEHAESGDDVVAEGADEERVMFHVPYREKDEAHAMGAHFDWDEKKWCPLTQRGMCVIPLSLASPSPTLGQSACRYAPNGGVAEAMDERWVRVGEVYEGGARVYFHVAYEDKEAAKDVGAQWEPRARLWYSRDAGATIALSGLFARVPMGLVAGG